MGTVIVLAAFVVEAAFAAYCIVTQSDQEKVRSYIRIGALAAFVVFALVSVIEWSFRWYGLAALLCVWAALGAWTLVRRPTRAKAYRAWRSVAQAVTGLLLVGLVVTPALLFPQYRLPKVTGTYRVAAVNYTYTDESRTETFAKAGGNRKVNVEFWYPQEGAERYPLVVFSHGSGGIKTSNTSTFIELASHGYVVVSIDHPYHSLFTIGLDRQLVTVDPAYWQEYLDLNNGKYDEATSFKLQRKWLDLRTADINFVLDTVLARAQDSGADAVYQRIDVEKIGLMGHSLGGAASAQVARERGDIDAVVNLDADLQGEYLDYVGGRYVLNDTPYPAPLLTIYSDDLVRLIAAIPDANAVIAVKHVSATAPHAYQVHLAGTNHMSLTDLPLASPVLASLISGSIKNVGGQTADPRAVIEQLNDTVLAFFNAYLKGEGSFSAAGTD